MRDKCKFTDSDVGVRLGHAGYTQPSLVIPRVLRYHGGIDAARRHTTAVDGALN